MNRRRPLGTAGWALALLLPLPCAADSSAAENWPAWRGPGSTGSASVGTYATRWSAAENLAWKVRLPGRGCSTPAVWGDRILLTCPLKGQDAVLGCDFAGRIVWRTVIGVQRAGKHRNGSGSNPSPVTDGERVFAYFKSGHLAGLDLEGKLLWRTNLQERFGEDTLWWDVGTSPVLTRAHVVVAVLQGKNSYLAAFEKEDGRLAWKVDRHYDCAVEGDQSYATPLVVEEAGGEALVVWGGEHLTAHDAQNGELIWSCGGFNPQRKSNWVTVSSPVITGDVVVVPYGRGERLAGVRRGGHGDVTDTHRLWTESEKGAFVPTPCVSEGKVYVVRDRGEVLCVDGRSGRTLWRDALPKHRSSYYASPVVAEGKLYATREDGIIFVVGIEKEFDLLCQIDMGERMIASPVPVRGRILLRGEEHLFCVATP